MMQQFRGEPRAQTEPISDPGVQGGQRNVETRSLKRDTIGQIYRGQCRHTIPSQRFTNLLHTLESTSAAVWGLTAHGAGHEKRGTTNGFFHGSLPGARVIGTEFHVAA